MEKSIKKEVETANVTTSPVEGSSNTKEPTLLDDLAFHKKKLAEQKALREHDVVGFTLDNLIKVCPDRSREIMKMLASNSTKPKDIKMLLTDAIEDLVDKNFITPGFKKNNKFEHEVLLFVGTHWMVIPPANFKDFVKNAVRTLGLTEYYYEDPTFMSSLEDFVAYRFAKPLNLRFEPGKVFINLQNGTIALGLDGSVKLLEHLRDDGFRYVLPYVYDPDAQCHKFFAYLDKVLPEKQAQDLLAEYIGYCLTDDIKVEKMMALYGAGSNGKSVAMDIIAAFIGEPNVSHASLAAITTDDKKRALINEKRLNISYESSQEVEPSMLKRIVSGEKVEAYVNYIGPITMQHYAKQIVSFNVLPKAENSYAYFRRFILMPFNVTISEEEKNVNLAKEIIAEELPGIFNWVLEGLKRFLRSYQFTSSKLCNDALERYRLQSDSVLLFIKTCCKVGEAGSVKGNELYGTYKEFCENEGLYPAGKQKFYERLVNHKIVVRNSSNVKVVEIKLKPYEV